MSTYALKADTDVLFDEHLIKIRKEKALSTIHKAPYLLKEFEVYLKGIFDFIFDPKSSEPLGSFNSRRNNDGRKSILILGCAPEFLKYVNTKDMNVTHVYPLIDQKWFEFCGQNKFDYVFDFMSFHWINDPLMYLSMIKMVLKKGGFYACGFLGGTTLTEFRQVLIEADIAFFGGAFGRVSPMIKPEAATRLLQSINFEDVVVDHEEVLVPYESLRDLVIDLRLMGETNALSDRPRGSSGSQNMMEKHVKPSTFHLKSYLDCAENHYQKRFKTKDYQITFDLIYMSGWA